MYPAPAAAVLPCFLSIICQDLLPGAAQCRSGPSSQGRVSPVKVVRHSSSDPCTVLHAAPSLTPLIITRAHWQV